MSLRAARDDDARAIARAHVRAWRHAYADVLDPDVLAGLDVEERAAHWAAVLAAPDADTVVFDQDGFVAGFVSLRGDELVALYVDPAAQGAGVGKILLARAEEQGACVATVFAANGHGRAFYEDHGWAEDGPAGESAGQPVVRYRCSSR